MPFMIVDQHLHKHPKTRDLARRLKQHPRYASGLLQEVWGWAIDAKPDGMIGDVPAETLVGTYIANLEKHGVGALNIDGSRIGTDVMVESRMAQKGGGVLNMNGRDVEHGNWRQRPLAEPETHRGRWPANVLLDEEAAAMLDAQSGDLKSGDPGESLIGADRNRNTYGKYAGGIPLTGYGDRGGASRFFYVAKASRADRGKDNAHPTVKPVELMRYLVRLVTPPGGIVLDPFAGSGTTGQAALAEGLRCVLIEREAEYVEGIHKWRGAMQMGMGL